MNLCAQGQNLQKNPLLFNNLDQSNLGLQQFLMMANAQAQVQSKAENLNEMLMKSEKDSK